MQGSRGLIRPELGLFHLLKGKGGRKEGGAGTKL